MTTLAAGAPARQPPPLHNDTYALRAAFSHIPQSVVAVCALDESGELAGFVVSTLTPVSLNPPLVSVCVQFGSRTWSALRPVPRIGVSVLSETQSEISRSLASGGAFRFKNVEYRVSQAGAVFICDAVMWMECAHAAETQVGDHRIVILSVVAMNASAGAEPLVFHSSRYRRLHPD